MGVEASIVVEFGEDTESAQSVVIELDDQHSNNQYANDDGEVEVKSNFLPTDSPVFLIHHDSDVIITGVKCSHGTVTKIGSDVFRSRTETGQLFSLSSSTITLPYNNVNSVSAEWYGNEAVLSISSSEIVPVSGIFPCYGDLTFNVLFNEQWKLTPPSLSLEEDETYNIAVVIYMENVK